MHQTPSCILQINQTASNYRMLTVEANFMKPWLELQKGFPCRSNLISSLQLIPNF